MPQTTRGCVQTLREGLKKIKEMQWNANEDAQALHLDYCVLSLLEAKILFACLCEWIYFLRDTGQGVGQGCKWADGGRMESQQEVKAWWFPHVVLATVEISLPCTHTADKVLAHTHTHKHRCVCGKLSPLHNNELDTIHTCASGHEVRWVRIMEINSVMGKARFLLWFMFSSPVTVVLSGPGLLPTGNSGARTHTNTSSVQPIWILFRAQSWSSGMHCFCWTAGRDSAWPWRLNTISMQPFITSCTLRNTPYRSEGTLCCHCQETQNWDKMKSVRT